MLPVTKKPEVWRDLESIADYFARQRFDLALKFLDAAEATFAKIAENPGSGFLSDFENPEVADHRVVMIRGFEKYLVFYRTHEDCVDIHRVLYGGRDLGPILGD